MFGLENMFKAQPEEEPQPETTGTTAPTTEAANDSAVSPEAPAAEATTEGAAAQGTPASFTIDDGVETMNTEANAEDVWKHEPLEKDRPENLPGTY